MINGIVFVTCGALAYFAFNAMGMALHPVLHCIAFTIGWVIGSYMFPTLERQ